MLEKERLPNKKEYMKNYHMGYIKTAWQQMDCRMLIQNIQHLNNILIYET